MSYTVAGIDIHKKVLMVVVIEMEPGTTEWQQQRRRFGAGASERGRLAAWLRELGVEEAVMESTAQYWKPVWYALERQGMKLQLAQAFSNRAPRGRKHDFRDAERLVRRLVANELILSFVPPPQQRAWRSLTRSRCQLAVQRVRIHNHVEALLEEMELKLSSVISDLFGVSGRRILWAIAHGQTDPAQLAALGSEQLRCSQEQLLDALHGRVLPEQQELLRLHLEELELIDSHIDQLNRRIAQSLQAHQEAVVRLAEVPGFGVDSAQQVIAEVGPQASTFATPGNLTSWAGTCPGRKESAEQNQSSRSPKGNKYLRRVLTEAAQAAVKTKGSHFQTVFRRLLPRLGYKQALWAIVNRLCRLLWKILHEGVRYIEQGSQRDPKAQQQRARVLVRTLRKLGYKVEITALPPIAVPA